MNNFFFLKRSFASSRASHSTRVSATSRSALQSCSCLALGSFIGVRRDDRAIGGVSLNPLLVSMLPCECRLNPQLCICRVEAKSSLLDLTWLTAPLPVARWRRSTACRSRPGTPSCTKRVNNNKPLPFHAFIVVLIQTFLLDNSADSHQQDRRDGRELRDGAKCSEVKGQSTERRLALVLQACSAAFSSCCSSSCSSAAGST